MEVTSPQLAGLDCGDSGGTAVDVLPAAPLTCTGNYTVSQEDLEAGQLAFTAQAAFSTLAAAGGPVVAIAAAPVVLTMAASPQLELDVVASSCAVINATGKSRRQTFASEST